MDAKERAHLRALCEAATPGPWDAIYDEDAGEWTVRTGHADVAVLTWQQALDALGLSPVTMRTAAFIAASRAAIPALLDALDAAERERDEARAETADLRATVDTMQVQLDAHREWLATAQTTGDEARAEVERLREQVRVWRTLACEGAISSRDLGAIGATESAMALAACARRAGQHAAQGAAAEREACAAICDDMGDAAEVERDACCDDRSRSLHAGRMHGADECARAIRARGAGGGA